MTDIYFDIPVMPTGKGRARASTRGKHAVMYTPAKTVEAERTFLALAAPYRPEVLLEGALSLTIIAYFPIPESFKSKARDGRISAKHAACLAGEMYPTKKPDASNIAKLCEDAMNTVFYRDDSQIVRLVVDRRYDDRAHVAVRLQKMTGNHAEQLEQNGQLRIPLAPEPMAGPDWCGEWQAKKEDGDERPA
jgi:Holliday junction resolvase RusA-like endonuclease